MNLITLLTDFGTRDVYVGVMKGVMHTIVSRYWHSSTSAALTLIDLTHEIPPQNIPAAQFNLLNAYPYFPVGTVHLAVVDPGVGSQRRAIAVELATGFLVGPDNGLFSGVLSQYPPIAAVELVNREYWRTPHPSSTFHGRDIFAPVAAHLACGVPLAALGQAIALESLVQCPLPTWTATPGGLTGVIQAIDRFGNLITSIPAEQVTGRGWSIQIKKAGGDRTIPCQLSYSAVSPGDLLALVGSHGWVEIAVNNGNAQVQLNLNYGDEIQLLWRDSELIDGFGG